LKKKYLIVIVHIAAWACFFLLPFVFFVRPRDPNFQVSYAVVAMLATLNFYLLLFYYFNTELLIPKLLARKKWLWYTLAILASLIIYVQIPRLFEDAIRAELPEKVAKRIARYRRTTWRNPFNGTTAVFFLVFTVGTCIKLIQQWLSSEETRREIENDKLNTELSFLKSQINPHFLFNTLNNIYSLAVVKSDATAPAVMKLSAIMRYVISDTKQNWVPLEKEIQFIQHYIDLQKVRLTEKVKIDFTVSGNIEGKNVAPLIFIPFVENAFKYGISTKENSDIIIRVDVAGKEVKLTVNNKIIAQERDADGNTGIGLKNTKRRLELLYPETHTLEVKKEENHFNVNLSLIK
jgi:two-component system LytT family sensor kinase